MHGDHASGETDLAASVSTESKKIIRLTSRTSIILLICAIIGTAILLVIPIPEARHHRFFAGLLNLGHVPLFALVAALVFAAIGRKLWTLIFLFVLVTGGELIQSLAPGRTPDVDDLLHGLIGVAIAWIWMGSKGVSRSPWRELITVGLLIQPVFDIGRGLLDVALGVYQFPMLCDFSTPGQHFRWQPNGARVRFTRLPDGTPAGKLYFPDHSWEYRGSEFIPVRTDWRGFKSLEIECESPELLPLFITIRDQRKVNNYDNRFNISNQLPPGRHVIRIPLEAIQKGPKETPLDLSKIDSVNIYIAKKDAPRTMYIRRVELVR